MKAGLTCACMNLKIKAKWDLLGKKAHSKILFYNAIQLIKAKWPLECKFQSRFVYSLSASLTKQTSSRDYYLMFMLGDYQQICKL